MRGRYRHLAHVKTLDPVADCEEIYRGVALREFPWDMLLALNLAFYRTYVIPSIATLIASTGELTGRPRKRADDTAILMYEMIIHGLGSERGRAAVRQLNRIHQRFEISADDYRYVLATLVVVPTRWVDRHGWRPLCCHERAATAQFYGRLGRLMNIKDIPQGYAEFARFLDAYEQRFLAPSPAATALMAATTQLFAGRLPDRLARFAPAMANCLLDPPVRRAVGAADPPWPARMVVGAGLRTRAAVLRFFHGPRATLFLADGINAPSYPDGYAIESVGPSA